MKNILCVYKPLGLSPLQTIRLVKQQLPEYSDSRIGFAGRLDPLAEGLLLLLIGEENKKKKQYEDMSKTYEFDVLFGISTDTYDTLGIITQTSNQQTAIRMEQIEKVLPTLVGKHSQPYPPYSSRTVNGIPLYRYAREGKLSEISLPKKEIEIYSLELLSPALLPISELKNTIFERIEIVSGEFRQDEIRSSWQSYLSSSPPLHFPVFKFRISCSSGTYVRSLAKNLGDSLGLPSLAYSIQRTAIGPYSLKDCFQLDPIA